MYVDDNKALTVLIVDYLSRKSYALDVCHDGETGPAKASDDKHYEVILLNVMLPKLDGFDVLKAIQQSCFTPIVLLSEKSDEFDRVFGLELGAEDNLSKPFQSYLND